MSIEQEDSSVVGKTCVCNSLYKSYVGRRTPVSQFDDVYEVSEEEDVNILLIVGQMYSDDDHLHMDLNINGDEDLLCNMLVDRILQDNDLGD